MVLQVDGARTHGLHLTAGSGPLLGLTLSWMVTPLCLMVTTAPSIFFAPERERTEHEEVKD